MTKKKTVIDMTFDDKFKYPEPEGVALFESKTGLLLSDYWHPRFRFDVIKYDRWLSPPTGESTSSWTTEKFGEELTALIQEWL